MSFEIVTDSSCNLPEDIIDRYGLHILSLRFLVGGKEYYSYTKGEITDLAQFYTMMRNKEEITTSQISSDTCTKLFESLLQDGKDVLYIGFSSALSGTYQVGYLALEELKKKSPERKIYAVDTLGASLGEGLLVYHAIFGTLLNVKPVMHMDNEGRLIFVTKVRGRKRSLDALVERLDQTAINPSEQSIFITHGDCLEDAQYVAKKIEEKYHPKEIVINWVDPVIGAHSGPGTVALFFLGTER